jgi:hypothetical protein
MSAGPEEVAGLLWQATAYMLALSVSYSLFRGAGMPGPNVKVESADDVGWSLMLILGFCIIYRTWFQQTFGMSLETSNAEIAAGHWMEGVPLLVAQITHNVMGIFRITMLGIVVFVFARRDWRFAFALTGWLAIDGYLTIINAGARTYYATLLVVAVLCWHRLVRPIGPITAALVAVVMLAGLMGYGYWREFSSHGIDADIWSAPTEFQIVMGTSLHVAWARAHDLFGEIPWQVTFNELLLPIPQQALPFLKLGASEWYIQQLGFTNQGLMFGVVAQSDLGFGLPEMIVRGAVLGAILAFIHRFCVRNADNTATLIAYLWLCLSIYYTYRAGSFYIVTWAIYRLAPFLFVLGLLRRLLRQDDRQEAAI